jgi:hypothetical protein
VVCDVDQHREASVRLQQAVGHGDHGGLVGVLDVGVEDPGRRHLTRAVDADRHLPGDLVSEARHPVAR